MTAYGVLMPWGIQHELWILDPDHVYIQTIWGVGYTWEPSTKPILLPHQIVYQKSSNSWRYYDYCL